MPDFETTWLGKFAASLDRVAGRDIREAIMEGSEQLSDRTARNDVIAWSRKALALLDERVERADCIDIMTGCACRYPAAELQDCRKTYLETGDIDRVIALLEEKFLSFLRDGLHLEQGIISRIMENKWGLAGYRDEDGSIIVTKIPKSGEIRDYFEEADPQKKRAIYCHCPRIRAAMRTGDHISPTYCYCGAGYYKALWEEVTRRPVTVELMRSVLKGDDSCTFRINVS